MEKVLKSIPDLWMYLLVAKKDMNRAIEMVRHSGLTITQRRILSKHLREAYRKEKIILSDPKNY